MSLEAQWPKKKDPPPKVETVAARIRKAHQEKLLEAEREEPLSAFQLAAIVSRLFRKR